MKKLIVLLSVLCIASALSAQIRIGVRAGGNLANFTGGEVVEWGYANVEPTAQVKFHLGVYLDYFLTDQISIQPGLFYSGKGPKYDGEIEVYNNNTGESSMQPIVFKKQLGYIDIPILVHFHVNESFSVFAGPQVSFLISAKVKNEASAQVLQSLGLEEDEDVKDSYRGIDLGLPVGVAYAFENGLNLQLNYDIGIIKIAKGYDIGGGEGGEKYFDVRNGVIKLSVGFTLKESN